MILLFYKFNLYLFNYNLTMGANEYIKLYFHQLTLNDILDDDDFCEYKNFKKFIYDHYQLNYLENNNYIKYVKVKRQILKLNEETKYTKYLNRISSIILILSNNSTFPNIDIKKYMFRIYTLLKLIDNKKKVLFESIKTINNLLNLKVNDIQFQFKIIYAVNAITHKYHIFCKYSKQLIYTIHKLIELETSYGIDHKLIELNNIERTFLGKKSEYSANKILVQYVNMMNADISNNKKYYYETNIDILKLFSMEIHRKDSIKGEIDGMIISCENNNYTIEKIIEVKSSVKSTFEDTKKFSFLQKYIKNMEFIEPIVYEKYIFTKKSFVNILNKNLTEWIIYICINNLHKDIIEKSNLYFSNVLKIIDDNFIKDFYIDNNENIIIEKHKIILNNTKLIDNLFKNWKKNIRVGFNDCNVFTSREPRFPYDPSFLR